MGNGRWHTLKVLGRIFFFQQKFTSGRYVNILPHLWNFSLSHDCWFQSQLQAYSFAHVLLMPNGVFCFPNKTKIYGTQSCLTQLLQRCWLIFEQEYLKIIRKRKIFWNSYVICIFSFVFVHLNANCTHSLINLAAYFPGHCNWFRSKSESCF